MCVCVCVCVCVCAQIQSYEQKLPLEGTLTTPVCYTYFYIETTFDYSIQTCRIDEEIILEKLESVL